MKPFINYIVEAKRGATQTRQSGYVYHEGFGANDLEKAKEVASKLKVGARILKYTREEIFFNGKG